MPPMRISKITYEDWKGLNETLVLPQVTLLLGPNDSGKTARLLGPMYAVTSSVPHGNQPAAVAMFAGPGGCAVEITTDRDFTWKRRLIRDARHGSLKTRIYLPGHEEDGLGDCEAIVHAEVGNYAPMFDIGEFLGMSIDKRRDFVLSLCSGEAKVGSGDDLAHEIVMEFCKLELGEGTVTEATHGHGGSLAELATKLKSRMSEARRQALEMMVRSIGIQLKQADVALAIGDALDSIKRDANGYSKTAKEAAQAARKISERKNELTTVADSVETLQERVGELRKQKEQVTGDLGLVEGRTRSVTDNRAGFKECTEAIETFTKELTDIESPNDEAIETTATALEAEAGELEKLEDPQNPAAGETGRALDAAHDVARAKMADVANESASLDRAKTSLESATKQLEMAEAGPWARCLEISRKVGAPISDLLGDNRVIKELWTELTSIIVANADAGVVELLREAVRNAEGDVKTARDRFDTATTAHTKADTELTAARDKLSSENKAFEAARATYVEERQRAVELRATAKESRDTAQATRDRIERLNRELGNLRTKQRGHEDRLHGLLEDAPGESVESLTQRGEALDIEIVTIEKRIKDKQAYQQLEAELARCQASAEAELTNNDVAKKIADAIREIRNRSMVTLVEPLKARIDWFLAAAGLEHHSYCKLENETGGPTFELGCVVDDMRRIALPALGGGVAAINYAALAYAIVDLADPPLKLLLLDIAEVDAPHLRRLLYALAEVGKRGMQVIAATHVDPQKRVEGVHEVRCSVRGEAPVAVGV